MFKKLLILLTLLASQTLLAQSEIDALRFSNTHVGGSARFNAMGGSMGALGGDLSLASINPGGISVMRKNEISFSPYLRKSTVSGEHYGNTINNAEWNMRVSNLGINISMREDDNEWSNVYLTYSYNNRLDFNHRTRLEANNPESSQLDVFFNRYLAENGTNLSQIENAYPFDVSLAWNTFLLDTFNNFFFTAIPNYGQNQIYDMEESGRIGENNFVFSGAYKDRLYIGAGVNLTTARYSLKTVLREEIPESDTSTFLKAYDYEQNLLMSGEGIGLKLGAIYKWNDWLRSGLAIHTPDFYSFTDAWNNAIFAEYESGDFEAQSIDGLFDYRIQTPWRMISSMAFSYKKFFLFNVDYEYVDYRNARLKGEAGFNNPFGFENESLRNNALQGHNFRFGSEYNYKSLGIRAGFAYYRNPSNMIFNADTRIYSLGIGNTLKHFYWDIAYNHRQQGREFFWIYDQSYAPLEASFRNLRAGLVMLTLGLRY